MGGMVSAIEAGYVQMEIQNAAYKFEKELEAENRIVVGVNKFQVNETMEKELLKINMNVQEEQIQFLNKIKTERNSEKVKSNLQALEKAAAGSDNLMPFILSAVKNYASIGEICNTMRSVFGEYKEHVVI
jgi:methylmalonyl-CoA mutase N-terminal domain/subunit